MTKEEILSECVKKHFETVFDNKRKIEIGEYYVNKLIIIFHTLDIPFGCIEFAEVLRALANAIEIGIDLYKEEEND